MSNITSWGRVLRTAHTLSDPHHRDEIGPALAGEGPLLAHGLGRSYGDVCLNEGGRLLRTGRLDRLIAADWEQGILRAEAGLSLGELLRLAVPRGWFLPVTPGTKFVTLGGAVANDVHGKNHETAGSFGRHVTGLTLLRSDRGLVELGPEREAELFTATIGGLGLTGIITEVELRLDRVASALFETETRRMRDLDAFFQLASEPTDDPYTVAWVDCLAGGAALGRGLFTRGRHAQQGSLTTHRERSRLSVPLDAPNRLLSSPVVRAFNIGYARRPGAEGSRIVHYDPFLYPLDGINSWNRLYGRQGFYQHQSVIPKPAAPRALQGLLELTSEARQGSFLVVLKMLGALPSPGLLSFPMEGATFALDLPNQGEATRRLLDRMAEIVMEAGGRLYPAKDATMSPAAFQAGFPRWRDVEALRDPVISSSFWRRVTREQP